MKKKIVLLYLILLSISYYLWPAGAIIQISKRTNSETKVLRTGFEMRLSKERGTVLLLLPAADLQLTSTAQVLPSKKMVFAESDTEQATTRYWAAQSCLEKGYTLWSMVILGLWPHLKRFICQQNCVLNAQAFKTDLCIHCSWKDSRQCRCENEPRVPS